MRIQGTATSAKPRPGLAVVTTATKSLTKPRPELAAVTTATKGDAPSKADAVLLQKKANEAQARLQGHGDSDQELVKAVETNNVALAKKILLKNGFTAKDLANAKISLRTGPRKGAEGKARVTISASVNTIIICNTCD